MQKIFNQFCQEYLADVPVVWVGLSGGADSIALLHVAYHARAAGLIANLQASHVNHNLSINSDKWQNFCQQLCMSLDIPILCDKVPELDLSNGLEHAARTARHDIWQKYLQPRDVLLLAHHQQDQIETILLRLCRGSGALGLSGMQQQSTIKGINIYRPFLHLSKSIIIDYLKQHNINYCDDESNFLDNQDRNFLRNQVLPLLRQRWPNVDQTIERAGKLCFATTQQYKKQNLEIKGEQVLSISKLLKLDQTSRFEKIRAWLVNLNYAMPSLAEIERLQQEVILARRDSLPLLQLTTYHIRRFRDNLYVLPGYAQKYSPKEYRYQNYQITYGIYGSKVKKIFQQAEIPPWERHTYPVVWQDGQLLAVHGIGAVDDKILSIIDECVKV